MKITKGQLRRIIREELLREQNWDPDRRADSYEKWVRSKAAKFDPNVDKPIPPISQEEVDAIERKFATMKDLDPSQEMLQIQNQIEELKPEIEELKAERDRLYNPIIGFEVDKATAQETEEALAILDSWHEKDAEVTELRKELYHLYDQAGERWLDPENLDDQET